jgi:DNA mismatch repair protein MutS
VARLAGLPQEVIERAKLILQNLESQMLDAQDRPRLARAGPRKVRKPARIQLNMFALDDALREELRGLDISNLTPLQALAKLEELKKKAEK